MTAGPPRLLVVDDEPFNLEILGEHLEGQGYDITYACDGVEALAILEGADGPEFDVIILDRMMPRLDGIAVLERIKADARLHRIPIVLQTAAAAQEQVAQGIRAGAFYYLTKPFDAEVLTSIVRAAVKAHASWRELAVTAAAQRQVVGLLESGQFSFRTLAEARALAAVLAAGFPDPAAAALGLVELLVNAVEHGNLGITLHEKAALLKAGAWEQEIERRLASPENRGKRVEVRFAREAQQVEVRIRDCGAGFDWRAFQELDPVCAFEPNGRGIALARQLSFPDLEYLGTGNEVRITMPVGAAQ
jgi:CheY-like chemotaxis protein/anti-sigma regulatory factor (Ser/Thr protein kinase)